jgi:hypothetical protein
MNLQLLQGEFSAQDSLDIITRMIHIKITHHENRITNNSSEEEIKYREFRIKRLQKELYEVRVFLEKQKGNVKLDSIIHINQ